LGSFLGLGPIIVLALFLIATTALAVYGLHLYVLVVLFRRRSSACREAQRAIMDRADVERDSRDWPIVTTQIPIYNEGAVAVRVMDAVAASDYPAGRHEIQVLDDSTDDTREWIDEAAGRLRSRGVDVQVIRRAERTGYKAGALSHGLRTARGQYVAIFDADFVPPPSFIRHAVAQLEAGPDVACLQGRWSHLNQNESIITRAQSLGIDGHFAIEQGARAWNGLMMNFNGTAGMWRKAAIEDPAVGGWSGDTLTEDLDLSYRAQLAGWRIDYCLDLPCPAELPGTVDALKSQQRRWATGSIQTAVKLLPRIWRSPLSLGEKLEATLHLTHYSVAVWMLLLAIIARPMLWVYEGDLLASGFWIVWSMILFAAVAPSLTYAYARYTLAGRWSGFRIIPAMIALGCGLCVNNALAVIRGVFLRGGEFVRTPKSGSSDQRRRVSPYRATESHMWILEIVLGLYSLACFAIYWQPPYRHRAFSFFLLFYAVGFLVVGWWSRPRRIERSPKRAEAAVESASLRPAVSSVGSTGG
jgi:cellulose synthase/poly-beta-1,6-N-acetylglucosamine synthase-like glycosyltransferase